MTFLSVSGLLILQAYDPTIQPRLLYPVLRMESSSAQKKGEPYALWLSRYYVALFVLV